MKYQKLGTRLLGYLAPNTTVNIILIDIKTDSIIATTSNACIESQSLPGLYIFNTSEILLDQLDDMYKLTDESLEIAYIMSNDLHETYGGKIVIDNDLKILLQIDQNISKIPDNVWNLLSEDDKTTYKNILKRIYQNTDLIPAIL